MSRHMVIDRNKKYVFGWDQHLMSFFLQVHDINLEEERNPIVRFGTANNIVYELDELVSIAKKHGLIIDYNTQVRLYGEKDGRG
jgi:hypothetical protein